MNKSAIQKFAIWARKELIAQVSQRAYQYGITEEGYGEADAVTVGGHALTSEEAKQRRELVAQIRQKGYTQVMEEVAYTWFNRFIALRFMEVNNYLPSHIRVFSDSTGAFKPEILSDALHLDLPWLDKDRVATYIENNQTEDLYRYLLLTQCNALNEALPRMFEKMGGYTELLFPNNILKADSVLGRMVTDIPEEDWTDQVQIIGWLYQYYNSELKDDTFALLKKNVKITKERIPSATQLFTPDWIVRYMVENSLGRLWIEGHPDDELKSGWKYYLDEAEQEPEVQAQIDKIHAEYATLKPQDIKVIDPCMGSGHILVYAFDVLIQIYKKYGVSERDAAQSILQNNLYGLDIDDRAAQLSYFAVMMKARQYDRRIFSRGIQPHVYAIAESNGIDTFTRDYFANNDPKLRAALDSIMNDLRDAKEYGSILTVAPVDFAALYARMDEVQNDVSLYRESALNTILPLIRVAEVLAQQYDVVVTNPPYRAVSDCSDKLNDFVKLHYPNSKNDLSTVFMEKTLDLCCYHGIMAMINIPVWMSKSSFENLRHEILTKHTFVNMLHCGRGIFGSDFGTTSFVIWNNHIDAYYTVFHQLFDEMGAVDSVQQKEQWFFERKNGYYIQQKMFLNIASYPIAYSTSSRLLKILGEEKPLSSFAYPRKGLTTGDNDRFVRLWFEVSNQKFSVYVTPSKWFPMTKGGDFRRWYGNNEYIVNWENDGYEIRNFKDEKGKLRSRPQNTQFYFREGISWNDTTATGKIAFRYQPEGYISNASGPCVFADNNLFYLFGLLNSVVSQKLLEILAPNMKFEVGQMALVPIIVHSTEGIDNSVKDTVSIVRSDWDSYETSWDFKGHPLVRLKLAGAYAWGDKPPVMHLASAYNAWKLECEGRFEKLKANEEELNRIFIDIYGLQDELTPDVADKDVTVHRIFDTKDDVPESMQGSNYVRTKRDEIVSLLSYAVGCMFGRYSLDVEGLAYAGGDWDASKYSTIIPDRDNIIPICDDDYFDDDMTGRFVKWVETVYGSDTLEENLKFIADALGGKGTPREVIRSYFLNDFYADHCKTYQKRPIYWLFDSGKKNGFKALIYMHRYQSDLLARMRTDYVHEQQERYRTQLAHLADALEHASGSERVKLTKQQKKLQDQSLEIQKYEEKIHHLADQNISIDLDDGVKHNYALFADVLAKIK
jgi:hypothetical protein